MPSSPPGSGYPDPTVQEPQRPDETGVRATAGPVLPGRLRRTRRASIGPIIEGSYLPPSVLLGGGWPESDADALRRDADAIRCDWDAVGRDLNHATTYFAEDAAPLKAMVRQFGLASIAPLHPCPLCGQGMLTLFGVKAHLSVDHSWWERANWYARKFGRLMWDTLTELFNTTIWLPWWVIAAVVALFGIAAAVGWWNR